MAHTATLHNHRIAIPDNTNHAYRHLRDTRYDERKHHQKIDSLNLASGLSHYSVLQGRYIASIKKLIRDYNLQQYDHIG